MEAFIEIFINISMNILCSTFTLIVRIISIYVRLIPKELIL